MEENMVGKISVYLFFVNENVGIKAIWLVVFNQDFMWSEKP